MEEIFLFSKFLGLLKNKKSKFDLLKIKIIKKNGFFYDYTNLLAKF